MHLRCGLLVTGLVFACTPAFAQPATPLFGPPLESNQARQALDISTTLLEGYDDNLSQDLSASQPQLQPLPLQAGGFYTALSPKLEFASRLGGALVAVAGLSEVRYYPEQRRVLAISHGLAAGVSGKVSKHTTLFANQGVVYSPALLYRLFVVDAPPTPGELSASAPPYAVNASDSYAYTTALSLTHDLTPATNVGFDSNINYTTFLHNV